MQESVGTMHTELAERLRFETLLVEISGRFVNVPADQVDSEIEGANASSANSSTLIAPHSGKSLRKNPCPWY